MKALTELTLEAHKNLKVKPDAAVKQAAASHVLNLRVTEIAKAACCFPLFISKNSQSGGYALSALTSIVPGTNASVIDGQWTALYQPTSVTTYPFFLMKSPSKESSVTIGIFEDDDTFSTTEGQALFEDNDSASLYLSEQTKVLEATIKEDIQTLQFLKQLEQLNLIKPIDLVVQYQSGESQVLKGLSTIDEDVLLGLDQEQVTKLHQSGVLGAIHGLLMSIYQINLLVRNNNQQDGMDAIQQIRLETARERSPL